ncbi:MAG: hypothetical protein ACRD5H_08035, partial [Nitrososphaerales archaeon]
TISTILAITAVATSNFSADDKHSGHHQEKDNAQKPQARVDGAMNPELIPDSAAYEILFRLLSSSDPTEQKREQRKSAYLRGAGFSDAEAAAITNAAYEYKRQIEPLDTEVDNIKHASWPNPSSQVMNQLTQLQRQKENLIDGLVRGLENQLVFYNSTKFRNHIAGEIKRKTKGFGTTLPTKKVGKLGNFFSEFFTVSAQASGCDALVYLYNNVTVDWNYMVVYGTGSYSLPYNNCGHTVNLATSLSGPSGTYIAGGEGVSLGLQYGGQYLDGYFLSNTEAEGWCPVVLAAFYVGSMAGDLQIPPWVKIQQFTGVSKDHIISGSGTTSDNTDATVSYAASIDASGKKFQVSVGMQITAGDIALSNFTTNPPSCPPSPFANCQITVGGGTFKINYKIIQQDPTGRFRAAVLCASVGGQNLTVINETNPGQPVFIVAPESQTVRVNNHPQ